MQSHLITKGPSKEGKTICVPVLVGYVQLHCVVVLEEKEVETQVATQVPAHHTSVIWAEKLLEFLAVDSHLCRCHHLDRKDIWGCHEDTGSTVAEINGPQ